MKEESKNVVKFLVLFILSFSMVITTKTISNAEQSGGTDMGIEFTEDYVPTDKETPNPQPEPSLQDKPKPKPTLLPQTGEKEASVLSVLGVTVLIGTVMLLRTSKEELN